MMARVEEIRLAASTLLERARQRAESDPTATPGSPLFAAMRPLDPGSTLADLGKRLAALQRAITFP